MMRIRWLRMMEWGIGNGVDSVLGKARARQDFSPNQFTSSSHSSRDRTPPFLDLLRKTRMFEVGIWIGGVGEVIQHTPSRASLLHAML